MDGGMAWQTFMGESECVDGDGWMVRYNSELMGMKKDLLLVAAYFLILSTVL